MSNADTLQVTTPTECEVVLTRVFDAPQKLVFDALTRPEMLRRWYGPQDWTLVICDIDLRVGGEWRFVVRRPDGKEIGQRGVYREVIPPERLVNTEWWEDWNPGESVVTTVLVEREGRTTFTATILFPSQEVRDVVLKSGLEHGAAEGYNKLSEYLSSIADSEAT
jgi:uncharacterized protein YndB with AHSA1/START domain